MDERQKFKPGSRVKLTVEAVVGGYGDIYRIGSGVEQFVICDDCPGLTVELLGTPLMAGEDVIFNRTHEPVKVLFVDGDHAALKGYCDGKDNHRWFMRIADLKRPDGTPIAQE